MVTKTLGIWVQLEEDGNDSIRQSWIERIGLWPLLHVHSEQQGILEIYNIVADKYLTAILRW